MPVSLTKLSQTSLSGLSFDNIITDIANMVKDSPDYNTTWDDFLSSDAGRMIVELFAYIADNLATRIDWNVNENFLSTATQKSSVMRILKILGYNFTLPVASRVAVDVTTSTTLGAAVQFYLTPPYDASLGTLTPFSISAKDKQSVTRNYELMPGYSTSSGYDYKSGNSFNYDPAGPSLAPSQSTFYEGTTYIDTYTAETDDGPKWTLAHYPVIEGSAKVYLVGADAFGNATETELQKVNSFLDIEAQLSIYEIPYKVGTNENESLTVSFGTSSLVTTSSKRLATGNKVRIFYRVGGGLAGDLTTLSINTTRSIVTTGGVLSLAFKNNYAGYGGADAETIEHAAIYAPNTVRTVEKAVTQEDYDTLLGRESSLVASKSYGAANMPTNIFQKYGLYIRPFDIWCYALAKGGHGSYIPWTDLTPSQYNKYLWLDCYLNNRFNEVYSFRSGYFNVEQLVRSTDLLATKATTGTAMADSSNNLTLRTWKADTIFNNYLVISTPSNFKSVHDTIGFSAKCSFDYSSSNLFKSITNLLVNGDSLRYNNGDSKYYISKAIKASFQSPVNLSEGVDLRTNQTIHIKIDLLSGGKGDTHINLTAGCGDSSRVSAYEISRAINKAFKNMTIGKFKYNYGDSTGKLGVASVVQIGSGDYLKLTSSLTGDSSRIYIKQPVSAPVGLKDATPLVFGSAVDGDTYVCMGVRKLALVSALANTTEHGNLYYQHGSLNFGDTYHTADSTIIYTHYFNVNSDSVLIGNYPRLTYTTADPSYRVDAKRIYNSVINGDTYRTPDIGTSDFQVRFTKADTDAMSLYAISNDWTLAQSTNPTKLGPYHVADSITIPAANIYLNINVDNVGWVSLDVTNGVSYGSGKYDLNKIVDNINTLIKANATYIAAGDPYPTATYASKIGVSSSSRISFSSPTKNNRSNVRFGVTANWSAGKVLFGIGDSLRGDSVKTGGDYFFSYDSTYDLMKLNRVKGSNMPDGYFKMHYLEDKRGDSTTDEYGFQNVNSAFFNTKIVGVSNTFKKTKFTTFDVAGTIYYNKLNSLSQVKTDVEAALTAEYALTKTNEFGVVVINRNYGVPATKSKILSLIHGISGVIYAEISYFGKNLLDSTTNQDNTLSCDFDEIIVLSENISTSAGTIHGMNFTYVVNQD